MKKILSCLFCMLFASIAVMAQTEDKLANPNPNFGKHNYPKGDDFEGYLPGMVLGEIYQNKTPWQSFGSGVADHLTVAEKAAHHGLNGATLVADWSAGNLCGFLYEWKGKGKLHNFSFSLRSMDPSPATHIKVQLTDPSDNVYRFDGNYVLKTAGQWKTFTFQIDSENLKPLDPLSPSGIEPSNVDKIQVLFVNADGAGVEILHLDDFAINQ